MVDWSNSSAPEVLPSITTKVEEDELEEDELEEEGEEDMEGEWPLDDALFPATTGTMTCVQLHGMCLVLCPARVFRLFWIILQSLFISVRSCVHAIPLPL
jgi:hypothetical protein